LASAFRLPIDYHAAVEDVDDLLLAWYPRGLGTIVIRVNVKTARNLIDNAAVYTSWYLITLWGMTCFVPVGRLDQGQVPGR